MWRSYGEFNGNYQVKPSTKLSKVYNRHTKDDICHLQNRQHPQKVLIEGIPYKNLIKGIQPRQIGQISALFQISMKNNDDMSIQYRCQVKIVST